MLSIVILTYNSEKYLREVLKSASWADEIIIVDSGSTDKTEQICAEFKNARFIYQKWLGFGAQKQFGVNLARNDWIFVLDSDEVMSLELKDEILRVLKAPNFCAYKVARLNYFFGRAVRNMGLYPDFSVRLFDRKFAEFDGREIHEKVVLKGENSRAKTNLSEEEISNKQDANLDKFENSEKILEHSKTNSGEISSKNLDKFGANLDKTDAKNLEISNANLDEKFSHAPYQIGISQLKNHFIHYAYESIEQFIAKQNQYSSLGAKKSKFKAIFSPFWTFFKLFVLNGGWKDGWRGYVIARLYAQYTFWKYIK